MSSITPELIREIKETLVKCDQFESDRRLSTLFNDPRINPWKLRLDTTSSREFRQITRHSIENFITITGLAVHGKTI